MHTTFRERLELDSQMQDLQSLSTVQSLSLFMIGRQQPYGAFDILEEAYFKASLNEAKERGLTIEEFVQQRLSSWCRLTRVNPMDQQFINLQSLQSNARELQDVQQPPASYPTAYRAHQSQEGDIMRYVNTKGTISNQNRYSLQAHQDVSPNIRPFNFGDLNYQLGQNTQQLGSNSEAIQNENEENRTQLYYSFKPLENSQESDKQQPVISFQQLPRKVGLKEISARVRQKIKVEGRKVNPTIRIQYGQYFKPVQALSHPINPSFSEESPYFKALESPIKRKNEMSPSNQSNLSGSPQQSLLLSDSPVKVSNTQVNKKKISPEQQQRPLSPFLIRPQAVTYQVERVVRVIEPPRQPHNQARTQRFRYLNQS